MLILHNDNVSGSSASSGVPEGRNGMKPKDRIAVALQGLSERRNLSSWSAGNQPGAKSRRAQRLCPTNVVYFYSSQAPLELQAKLSLQLQVQVW